MNKVEWVMRVGGNVHFVYAKPCWFLWFSMDQEHSGNQADTSQPAAESQPSLLAPCHTLFQSNPVHGDDTAWSNQYGLMLSVLSYNTSSSVFCDRIMLKCHSFLYVSVILVILAIIPFCNNAIAPKQFRTCSSIALKVRQGKRQNTTSSISFGRAKKNKTQPNIITNTFILTSCGGISDPGI